MIRLVPKNPFQQMREQKKRDERAKLAEQKIREKMGDGTASKVLGKAASFLLKQDSKRY